MHHLAVVTTSFPDETPGAEAAGSFVADFAEELARSVRVSVLAPAASSRETERNGVRIRHFAVPRLPLSLLNPLDPACWSAIVKTLYAGRNAVKALVTEDPPDHVLALWALPSGWWAETIGRGPGVPYSTWALGSDIWSLGRVPFVRRLLKRVLTNARNRYADGYGLCEEVERLSGAPCAFLPSTRRLPKPRETGAAAAAPYRIAYLGRWHRNKGTDVLMASLELLREDDWERITEIRVFGGGPLEDDVRAGARRLADGGHPITVGGYLDRAGAAELIGWADYLLIPSRIESIPVVLSDAIQLGTPLVLTPVGDLPVLHERFGLGVLASAATPEAFAEALRSALSRDARSFGPGLERAYREFDLSASAARVLTDLDFD